MQIIYCIFLPIVLGIFDGFSADGDGVTDRLPDGSTDKSNEVHMEGNFPRIWTLEILSSNAHGYFHHEFC